jgi:plastocyanin
MHTMNVRGVRTLFVAVCLAGLAGSGGTVSTAQQGSSVRGRVEIGIPVTARRPSAAYATRSVAQPVLAPVSELRHVVVFLKNAPAVSIAPRVVEIRQRDENFIPRVVAVPVGSEVQFPNDDPIYHNVARDEAGRRQGVLRDSLAHDRDDHGLQSSVVCDGRRGRPIRAG